MYSRDVKEYTVWVGGTEVNDYLITHQQAIDLAKVYTDDGYDQVQIDRYDYKDIDNV